MTVSVIPDLTLKRNKSERMPCVLIVDGSTSMRSNGAIEHLNEGLAMLERELKSDDDVADSAQISIVRMGGYDEIAELTRFVDGADFKAPKVEANGSTPLGKAVDHAMQMIEQQKLQYRQNGIAYKRPWLWIMSDGAPTDNWEPVAERARAAQVNKQFTVFTIAVGDDVPLATLQAFTLGKNCYHLSAVNIRDMFSFLSASMAAGSKAAAGQQMTLPPRPATMIEL